MQNQIVLVPMCLKTYRFTSSLQFSALWKMLANQICFPKSSCVPPEKFLKIIIFRARVHSVIWLEYVSVLFDLVGIFGEFICAHTLYFFEKTDVGTGGTTPKRSSTGVFDGHDFRFKLRPPSFCCSGGAQSKARPSFTQHPLPPPPYQAPHGMDGTVASCRAAVRGGPPRLGRAVVRGGPPRRGRSAARGGPARLHVEGRRVVPGQPYVEGRHGRTWTAGASLPSELWQDGTGTATGGTDA